MPYFAVSKERENNKLLVLGWQFWFQTSVLFASIAFTTQGKRREVSSSKCRIKIDKLLFSRS